MKKSLNRLKNKMQNIGVCIIFVVMLFPIVIGEELETNWNINSNWLDELGMNTSINSIKLCKPIIKSDSINVINITCGTVYGGYGINKPYAFVFPKNHNDIDVGESDYVWASVYVDIQLKELDNIGGTVRVRISWVHDPNSYWEGNFTDTYHGYFSIKSRLSCNSTYFIYIYASYTWPTGFLENEDFAKIITKDRQRIPNQPSIPTGPTYLKSDEIGNFSGDTTDPDGDQIFYMFDWGEGENNSGWLGPYKSDQIVKASKSWSISQGSTKIIEVRLKAKDIYGNEGNWSDPLIVKIIKTKSIEYSKLSYFFYNRLIQRFPIFEKIINKYYNP